MNTSPEEQVVDVPFEDVFRDLVLGHPLREFTQLHADLLTQG